MAKYKPLADHLDSQPDSTGRVELPFAEIERILGDSLPPSARRERPWWANTPGSVAASWWLAAGWKLGSVDLEGEVAAFVRLAEGGSIWELSDKAAPGTYGRLRQYLEAVPDAQSQLALTFGQIEGITGHKLPKSARTDRPWWANTKSQYSPQGRAWMAAGWRVDQPHLAAEIVVFRRPNTDPTKRIRGYVKGLLSGKAMGSPGPETLAQWIRLCKQLGWYWEGTVLYERSGAGLHELGDAAAVAVEEDYQVCKREVTRHQG